MNSDVEKAIQLLLQYSPSAPKYTFSDWLEKWITTYKEPKLKKSTLRDYRRYIDTYILPKLGNVLISDLDGLKLQEFINDIKAPNIRKKVSFVIKSSLQKAVKLRYIFFNPFDSVEVPRAQVNHYKPLSFEMQEKIFSACSDKYRPAFVFLCCTGLRIGEFLALDFEKDINVRRKTVHVTKTRDKDTGEINPTPKTENSIRTVPFALWLLPYVEELKNNVYTYSGIRNYFSKLYRRLRITGCNLHSFRHTFVSVCNSVGMKAKTAQALVGHSDVNLTLNIYAHYLKKGRSFLSDYLRELKKLLE